MTHSLDEMLQLADSAVLLEAGTVRAVGPITEIATRADLPLAARDDAAAELSCTVAAHEPARQLTRLAWGSASLWVAQIALPVGQAVRARILAREVILAHHDVSAFAGALSLHNVLIGIVKGIAGHPARHASLVEVEIGGANLLSRVTPDAVARLGLAPGAPVAALIKSMSIVILDGAAVRAA